MIRSFARRCASAISLVTIVAMSAPALADTPAATTWTDYHYDTAITTVYGSPYPIAGKLDIQITQEGILRGYYHNAYQKAFIQVVGGRDGNYIWFDIGPSDDRHRNPRRGNRKRNTAHRRHGVERRQHPWPSLSELWVWEQPSQQR